MRVWIVASLIFTTVPTWAADTNSDLFTRCPAERQALSKYENQSATRCQQMISDVVKCCNLKSCRVRGIEASATEGNVEGGQLMIAALQALSAGLAKNISMCSEGTTSAALPCYSKERGATPADKPYIVEFQNAEGRLEKCLAGQKVVTDQQVIAAGGTVQESGGRPTYGNDVKEGQIIQSLQPK